MNAESDNAEKKDRAGDRAEDRAGDASRENADRAAMLRGHSPWLVAFTVTLATFMEVLDTSIANVALPHIAGSLSADLDASTWVLTSYLVANAIILPLSGWASVLIGRKRYYMLCVTLFVSSSFLCGLAPSLGMLVVFRILQGLGGGGLAPSEQAILADTFPPAKRGLAFAFYGFAVVAAPAIGPTLGGWITDRFTWRWIFFINIPVGIISLFLTSWIVHDPPALEQQRKKQKREGFSIDYIGLGLIALGLGLLQFVLDKGNRDDWFGSTPITVAAVISAIALTAAIFWELRVRHPIVDLRMFKNRNFAFSNVLMFVLGFVLLGSTALIPQFTQEQLGYTATYAGLVLSPGAIVVMALMPLVGYIQGKFDLRWIVALGLVVGFFGLQQLASLTPGVDFYHVMMARIFQAAGIAFLFVPISTLSYANLRPDQNTDASGMINLARNMGGSVGIAVSVTFLTRWSQTHQTYLNAHATPYDRAYAPMLSQLAAHFSSLGQSHVDAARRALQALYQSVISQATTLAYLDVFRMMSWFFLLALPLCFIMKKPKHTGAALH